MSDGLLRLLSRLARRGGVKRISMNIYDEIGSAMTDHLKMVRRGEGRAEREATVHFLSRC